MSQKLKYRGRTRCQFEADCFLNAFEVLSKNNQAFINQEAERTNSGLRQTFRADVVCLAFSLELFLKDLHFVISGEPLNGHKIRDLFDRLPEEIQVEILSYHPDKHLMTGLFPYHGKNPLERFKMKIDQISDGFVKWRYSHEYSTLQYEASFVIDLIMSIVRVTNRLDRIKIDNIRTQRAASA